MAWTEAGGDVLFIEVTLLPGGNQNIILTGQLGNVTLVALGPLTNVALLVAERAVISSRPIAPTRSGWVWPSASASSRAPFPSARAST